MEDSYLIWHIGREKWWRAAGKGYTDNPLRAGVFTTDQAQKQCARPGSASEMHAVQSEFVRENERLYLEGRLAALRSESETLLPFQLQKIIDVLKAENQKRFQDDLLTEGSV